MISRQVNIAVMNFIGFPFIYLSGYSFNTLPQKKQPCESLPVRSLAIHLGKTIGIIRAQRIAEQTCIQRQPCVQVGIAPVDRCRGWRGVIDPQVIGVSPAVSLPPAITSGKCSS
jgi:hypothetical protein